MVQIKEYLGDLYHWVIAAFIVLIFYLGTRFKSFFSLRSLNGGNGSQNTSTSTGNSSSMSLKDSFLQIAQNYGKPFAQDLERLFRLETAHFRSGGWADTKTAGIIANTNTFPFGWSSLSQWVQTNNYNPSDFSTHYTASASDGRPHTYVVFPNESASVLFTGWFLANVRGGDVGLWFTLDKTSSAYTNYMNALRRITPRFVV